MRILLFAMAAALSAGQTASPLDLSAALANARPGEKVRVFPGVYMAPAGGFRLDKEGLQLVAEGPGDSVKILPGAAAAFGFVVSAAQVRIEGFEISGFRGASIRVDAPLAEIVRNYLHDNRMGIHLSGGSGSVIRDNVIRHSGDVGILDTAGSNTIAHNILHHNEGGGIFLNGSPATRVVKNRLTDNGRSGIHLAHSGAALLDGNVCLRNGAQSSSDVPVTAKKRSSAPDVAASSVAAPRN